ncbi:uncharacterized protein BDW70DRAFT_60906 [Aspergillus foveolatus]|uniref:uncharacterized protein n=1 Tax=Aspergillus foveolatus TaxID=210207 RepID=UPI003CCCA1C6
MRKNTKLDYCGFYYWWPFCDDHCHIIVLVCVNFLEFLNLDIPDSAHLLQLKIRLRLVPNKALANPAPAQRYLYSEDAAKIVPYCNKMFLQTSLYHCQRQQTITGPVVTTPGLKYFLGSTFRKVVARVPRNIPLPRRRPCMDRLLIEFGARYNCIMGYQDRLRHS